MAIVLKSDTTAEKTPAARSVSGLAGFNLSDLADEGRSRLDECRAQIHQMLEEANSKADSIRQEAEQRGYQEGLERAAIDADQKLKVEAERRAKDGLRVIQDAVQKMHRAHEDWMHQYSESLTQVALSAAEKIVLRRLQDEPKLLVQWADEAMQSTRASTHLTLAVHPETLAQLGQAFDELLAGSHLPEQTAVIPDETVPLNEVVVRQHGGDIQAGLTAQLSRLQELLA
ncbi:MAG: FliH/SctL family protein [Rubripirellula sp.]